MKNTRKIKNTRKRKHKNKPEKTRKINLNKKIKGGVRIKNVESYKFSPYKEAMDYFLENSTFKILTNDSISCITLLATLNNTKKSPFLSMRSNDIDIEIRTLLMKIFITHTHTQSDFFITENKRGLHNGIEITNFEIFKKEIEIQKDIFQKSFIDETSFFDPICPAIVFSEDKVDKTKIEKLPGLDSNERKQLDEILIILNTKKDANISIIFMEFMEGFETAKKVIDAENKKIQDKKDAGEEINTDKLAYRQE
jgi:hypothetical protein